MTRVRARRFRHLFAALLCVSPPVSAMAQSTLTPEQQAILEFADRLCGTIATGGSTDSIAGKGELSASLTRLLRSLAAAGVSGATEFNLQRYEGVLQEQLAADRLNVLDCRRFVVKDLSSRLDNISNNPSSNDIGEILESSQINISNKKISHRTFLDSAIKEPFSLKIIVDGWCKLDLKVNIEGGVFTKYTLVTKNGTAILNDRVSSRGTEASTSLAPGTYELRLQPQQGAGLARIVIGTTCE